MQVVDILISNFEHEEESIFNRLGTNQINEVQNFFADLKTCNTCLIKNQGGEVMGIEFSIEPKGDWKVYGKVKLYLTDNNLELKLNFLSLHLCCTFGSLKFPNCPKFIRLKMSENTLAEFKADIQKISMIEKSLS